MNNLKRIISLLLSVIILMTHLIVLDHSLEHHHSNSKKELTSSLEYEKVTDANKDCSLCNIYLDVELSKDSTFTYTIVTPKLITDFFLEKDNSFTSVVFSIKKSRAPPYFIG
ncbi:hypothetical protein PG911_07680 [Tenacibaculum ovolyticum]|uniref:hypothetical protein n=1 Tax=Tenacibaculum ovolyticum TaxID=104270 RepID=UPI0022F38AFF|nr:hypothetical protein [Tenacibaculum ovolyticum]WBX78127.1 hypothetical protein PG911_07680 [Tenacibaculum ovolyticum]